MADIVEMLHLTYPRCILHTMLHLRSTQQTESFGFAARTSMDQTIRSKNKKFVRTIVVENEVTEDVPTW
eukprot:3729765-Amphidinium_carterae.1